MKKYIFLTAILLMTMVVSAKKVKFSLDLTGISPNTTGVHVAGDFQAAAGFPADWEPGTTSLTNEPGTEIYSIVVDLPAFAKYEYKFLNGDQWYDVEFVPEQSRVGFNFSDNRWIYVDSLANDTTAVGPLPFGGNSPVGTYLLRFKVGMQLQPNPNPEGVHVAGSFQGWDPAKTRMYSFDGSVYEYIAYVNINTGNFEYKYANGNTAGNYEIVPSGCATNGNRSVFVTEDKVLDEVCFSECSSCSTIGIFENEMLNRTLLYPNPASGNAFIMFNDQSDLHQVVISDVSNRKIRSWDNYQNNVLLINNEGLNKGIYFVQIRNKEGVCSSHKLIIQ